MHLMVLQGDVGHVESRFGPFRDSVNLDAREVHGFWRKYYRLGNYLGHTQWNSSVTSVLWNLVLAHL
jgi:hypothetical protein